MLSVRFCFYSTGAKNRARTVRRAGPPPNNRHVIAIARVSNRIQHPAPPGYPPAQQTLSGFGPLPPYPGNTTQTSGYPMTGMGPHPGAQPGLQPSITPPPYPGVQQHQPPMAAGYPGTTQAPQQQPPMATAFSGTQAPQQHTQQASGPM